MALGVVPPVIRAWCGLYPGVRVELQEFSGADRLAEAMARGTADVAVAPAATSRRPPPRRAPRLPWASGSPSAPSRS